MFTIQLQITQEDIDHGTERSCFECPIAKALQRFFNTSYTRTGQTLSLISLMDCPTKLVEIKREEWSSLLHDIRATNFVFRFDGSFPVKPQIVSLTFEEWPF